VRHGWRKVVLRPRHPKSEVDAVEDRLVEAFVALENDQELVASITGCEWIINCR
jgi:hypothetical protein